MTYNTQPMDTNTLEAEPNYFNPPNEAQEDIHYNPSETTIYDTDDLDRASICLDNLCIISHFCTLSSLDDYVSFLRDHLD